MNDIYKLSGTESGIINELIHISDIHIRNGDEISSRYDEYSIVFNNLFNYLKTLDNIITKKAAIVITGDTFHNKSKVETPGIMLFNKLMNNLGQLAPVYVILGNHDFRQEKIDNNIDFLQAFEYSSYKNVYFLQKTGLYKANNIGFGLVSVKETLSIGSGSGIAEHIREFPDPSAFSKYPDITTTVALFHGTMKQSKFSENRVTNDGYSWDWIDIGYNIALLGDIHKKQVFPERKSGLIAGYSGSLLQQNFGESLFGHGILIWNVENNQINIKSKNIKNDYGYLKLIIKDDTWYCDNKDLDYLVQKQNFPQKLNIRIFGKATLEQYERLKIILKDKAFSLDDVYIRDDVNSTISTDYSSDVLLDEYMKNNGIDNYQVPSFEYLKIDIDETWNSQLIKTAKKKNGDIDKEFSNYRIIIENISKSFKIYIKYIEWNGLLCYSSKNWVDFNKMEQKTNLISAKNGGGKSSFLEIICLGIFGKPIPSRNIKGNAHALICKNKDKDSIPQTAIHIQIGSYLYRICRFFDNEGKPKQKMGGVYIHNNNLQQWNIVCKDPPKTNEWVLSNLGDIKSFLMTTMITQSNDDDFLSMKQTDQRYHLEQLFGMKTAHAKASLFKQSYLITKSFKNMFDMSYSNIPNLHPLGNKDALEAVTVIYELKKNIINNLNSKIYQPWTQCNTQDLQLDKNTILNKLEHIKSNNDNYNQFTKNIEQLENVLINNNEKMDVFTNSLNDLYSHEDALYKQLTKFRISINKKPKWNEEDLNNYLNFIQNNTEKYQQSLVLIQNMNEQNELYNSLVEKITKYQNKINIIQDNIDSININLKDIPYNEECESCKKQPLRLQLNQLIDNKNKYDNKLQSLLQKSNTVQKIDEHKYNQLNEFITQFEKHSVQKEEYTDNIQQWSKYNNTLTLIDTTETKLDALRIKITEHRVSLKNTSNNSTLIQEQINKLSINRKNISSDIDYWNLVYKYKNIYDEQQELHKQIITLTSQIQELHTEKQIITNYIKNNEEIIKSRNEYENNSSKLQHKMHHLQSLAIIYDKYRAWLYKEHVIPKIIYTTNSFISKVETNIKLDCIIQDDGAFIFQAIKDNLVIQLEKTSGFEYFMLSICLRLAFITMTLGDGHIGGQLIIDEGFTYCDVDHLSKIPNFLQTLLSKFDSIVLVSHLEKIKDSVDSTLFIKDKRINYGNQYYFHKPKK
tara:strand:- start:10394 stop:13969 length:3576 start_codon:yes stop_codon:yes gene_type:complete